VVVLRGGVGRSAEVVHEAGVGPWTGEEGQTSSGSEQELVFPTVG